MPVPGQSPLTTINSAKGLKIAYQPLLLADITMPDGTTKVRLSTENLDSTDGGTQYQGFDWKPRLISPTLGEIQSVTDNGIVQSPQVTLDLADTDGFLWQYELAQGWKGARLVLKFVFWDPDTATFSSDELVKFVGICNAPKDSNDTTLSLLFTNILNLANYNVPTVGVSRLCPWMFPTTKAQRIQAAVNRNSPFYRCGYSPDVTDSDAPGGTLNARGNYIDGAPSTSCTYTWDSCIANMGNISLPTTSASSAPVQIEEDTSGRSTARFGGIRYDPPLSWRGRSYLSGNTEQNINNPNDAKYNNYIPMVYGTSFVEPLVMNIQGEANSTLMEVVLCLGQIHDSFDTPGPIQMVIVNDVVVPFHNSADWLLNWSWVTNGWRSGSCNRSLLWGGAGDPYGSMAAIVISVPRLVTESNSIPSVKVLMDGPKLRQWNSANPNDFTESFTTNAAWILADLLTWCNFQISDQQNDFDLQTWIDAAAVCDGSVSYTDLTGTLETHPRYQLGLVITQRVSAADKVKNLLNAMKGMLTPNTGLSDTNAGKLQLFLKQTIADQQPVPVEGSNDDTPFDSAHANGDDAFGYPAYSFTAADILRVGPNRDSPTTFHIEQRPISDTPNRLSITLQDEDYFYAADTLSIVDSDDVARSGQQVIGGVSAEGIVNFDQGKRVLQTQYGEQYRGNPRPGNDSGGTWIVEFETSFKAIHIRVGHLVTVTYAPKGLDHDWFRVISVSPIRNCERIKLRMQWHEDDWYTDAYGQNPDPRLETRRRAALQRPPYGWLPNYASPDINDVLYNVTEKTFGVADTYGRTKDGLPLANVRIRGYEPVNSFTTTTTPPYAPEAVSTLSAGNVPAGHYYMALSAEGTDGLWTTLSYPMAQIDLASPGTISLTNIYWQSGSIGYKIYAGTNPNKLSLQIQGAGTPASIDVTSYNRAGEAAPDATFSHLRARAKKIRTSGIFGQPIIAVSGNTVSLTGITPPMTPGIFNGRTCIIIPSSEIGLDEPIWNFTVSGNTTDEVTLVGRGGATLDLAGMGVAPGDGLIIRAQAVTVTPNSLDDPLWNNHAWSQYMDPIPISNATNASPIVITTQAAHPYVTGDQAQVINVLGNTNANTAWSVTVIDDFNFSLDGSSGNADYAGGGSTYRLTPGLIPDGNVGSVVLFIGGTGRGMLKLITGNTATGLVIDGQWDVTPDATSVFILLENQWLEEVSTTNLVNADPTIVIELNLPVPNFSNQWLWVQVFSENPDDSKESIPSDSPGRELVVLGLSVGSGTDANLILNKPGAEFVFGEGPGGTPGDISVGMTTGLKSLDAGEGGTLLGFGTAPETAPTGSDAIFDVIYSRPDGAGGVLTDNLSTLAGLGTSAIACKDGATPRLFDKQLWQGTPVKIVGPCTLQGIVVQKGSTTPGQRISVDLYWSQAAGKTALV